MSRPLLTLIIALIGGNPFWFQIAFWQIVAGIIGAWQPLSLALSTGWDSCQHQGQTNTPVACGGNLLVLSCFTGSLWLRNSSPQASRLKFRNGIYRRPLG